MPANLAPGGPFDVPKTPFKLNELRTNEYWERVEQRFGVVMSEPRHAWSDDPEIGPVVATYATPIAILKGERIARPRVPETMQ